MHMKAKTDNPPNPRKQKPNQNENPNNENPVHMISQGFSILFNFHVYAIFLLLVIVADRTFLNLEK